MSSVTQFRDGGLDASIGVECYSRAATAALPVDGTIRRLRGLDERGGIDSLSVHVWPDRVDADAGQGDGTVAAFETFETWADAWGVEIRPPFEVRTRHSEFTGRTRTTLVTPVTFLAVSADGVPVGLYPHSADGTTHTVEDALAALEDGRIAPPGATVPPPDPAAIDSAAAAGPDADGRFATDPE